MEGADATSHEALLISNGASRIKAFAVVCLALTWAWPAELHAQVAEAEVRATTFIEPSPTSKLLVLNPAVTLGVLPADWLKINAQYQADIVSGATEAIKGGRLSSVDVVSSATDFNDVRHLVSGGFSLLRETTELTAAYSYGTEKDYRSQSFAITAGTTFLQKNTELNLSYARGFDSVCTSNYAESDAPSARTALDSSTGCFTNAEDRAERDVNLDNFQAGWTQTWTPIFATQVVLTGALQNGFLENPYRSVVIAPAGDLALENHPDNRARGAVAVRGRIFVKPIDTAFGLGVRVYRDTWDVVGQTYELEAERYMFSWLRALVRARYYTQGEALFWSDDYTGGEPIAGPRGQYWSGDRELSPLTSYLLGLRLLVSKEGRPDERIAGMFLGFSASAGLDLMKTTLDDFTWGGTDPDDTAALIGSLGIKAEF